jgi:oxygen-independent coproporphyrinogen-3 oxidase
MDSYSLYIHIPFCRQRCGYCDFNTYAGQESAIPGYIDALCTEIDGVVKQAAERLPVHTIFFGGGTPSILPVRSFIQVLEVIRAGFLMLPNQEITLEANPGTVTSEYLHKLVEVGFNRISFGMQSADATLLQLLNRLHEPQDVINAVSWAKQAGFGQINLDLIYGIPLQTMESWQESIDLALAQHPDHLSLYALTVEEGTPLYARVKCGEVPEPDPDLAADMYEWVTAHLDSVGYQQYEISNWAKINSKGQPFYCRHNLQYWRNQPYLGFGAGAHGYAGGYRTANVPGIADYIKHMQAEQVMSFPFSPANTSVIKIDKKTEMQETMMVGLRLIQEGVSASGFLHRFDEPVTKVFGSEIADLIQRGLLERAGPDGDILRLTQYGRLLGNQVFMRFVGDC